MKMFLMLSFLFVAFWTTTNSARILGVLHIPTASHYYIGETILKGLASKGHNVTIVSSFISKENISNYREIFLDGVYKIMDEHREFHIKIPSMSIFTSLIHVSKFMFTLADKTVRSPAIQKLIKSGEKFDVLLLDPYGSEALFGLAHVFNSHLVIIDTANSQWIDQYAGNVAPYSFVPNVMTPFSDKMTFRERAINFLVSIIHTVFLTFLVRPKQKILYEEMFKNAPPFEESIKNASLLFVNSHVVVETPRPYLPIMIPIGGIHIKEPKQLPIELQTYLDSAKDGVILFSLGSNLRSSHLPVEMQQEILRAFSKFPQKVLWKFENENLPNKPKNVKISKWLPQTDILAHSNVKLFITHGGLLSTIETIFRGVPVIGIPLYGDQYGNVANLVSFGYGQSILLEDLTEDSFTNVIKEVLYNSSYQTNIKKTMMILQDQPDPLLDRAIFWVEHVIKHNGARHLRSAAVDIPLYQYLCVDILGAIAVVFCVFITLFYVVVRKICHSLKKCVKHAGKREHTKPKKE